MTRPELLNYIKNQISVAHKNQISAGAKYSEKHESLWLAKRWLEAGKRSALVDILGVLEKELKMKFKIQIETTKRVTKIYILKHFRDWNDLVKRLMLNQGFNQHTQSLMQNTFGKNFCVLRGGGHFSIHRETGMGYKGDRLALITEE